MTTTTIMRINIMYSTTITTMVPVAVRGDDDDDVGVVFIYLSFFIKKAESLERKYQIGSGWLALR